MNVSYSPLRKVLKERDLKVTNVCRDLGFATHTRTKLSKDDGIVSLSTIVSLCHYLDVPIEQVVEVIPKDRAAESSELS